MASYSFAILFGCSLVLVCFTGTKALALTFEDQLAQLTDKYNEIQQILAEKDTGKLEEKVNRLEEKVSQLEHKVEHLEFLLIDQHLEKQQVIKDVKSIQMENKLTAMDGAYRTCQEMYDKDSTLVSGWYWIDPDGQAFGDSAIHVYCDVASEGRATTVVPHDSEAKIEAAYCLNPGCYSRKINYNASMNQMITLATLSTECHQHHRYDCIDAPFEFDGAQYSWWSDRNGNQQYFWAGSASQVHRCECGIDGRCVNTAKKCNCDSGLSTPLFDSGFIQAKELLPVTQLNFGRALGSGQHTLGRFECTGKETINGMPHSCLDLWRIGYTLNGIYSVMGSNFVETVFCDFTKPLDQDFQTWIGYADVKSKPIYFYVQRNSNFESMNTPITFHLARINTGESMNLENGIFTAPKKGTYFFSFSGKAQTIDGEGGGWIQIFLKKNGGVIAHSEGESKQDEVESATCSIQSTLPLNVGDRIWLEMNGEDAYLFDNSQHFTHFTGFLLEEDIF